MARASWYGALSRFASRNTGKPAAFTLACTIVLVWIFTGPIFDFSDTWQLVINTGTTIITFLMGFLIQNTQSRDTDAMQIKLDELIRVTKGARQDIISLEELSEDQLLDLHKRYKTLTKATQKMLFKQPKEKDIIGDEHSYEHSHEHIQALKHELSQDLNLDFNRDHID